MIKKIVQRASLICLLVLMTAGCTQQTSPESVPSERENGTTTGSATTTSPPLVDDSSLSARAEKKYLLEKFDECSAQPSIVLPGLVAEIKDTSLVITINQGPREEQREIEIVDATEIVGLTVTGSGESGSERSIALSDLRVGADVVVSAVAVEPDLWLAREIKFLSFE